MKLKSTVVFVCMFSILAIILSSTANAAHFVIDSIEDNSDTSIDGICNDEFGNCTLRAAIEEINEISASEVSDIVFALELGNTPSIHVLSALPTITRTVTINGGTSGGRVEIAGTDDGLIEYGLRFSNGNSIVSGLAINRFKEAGISFEGDGNILYETYVGTDITGTVALGTHENAGVLLYGSHNIITRCVLSGNLGAGAREVLYGVSINNTFSENYVGLDASGEFSLGNEYEGIEVKGYQSLITRNYFAGIDGDEDALENGEVALAVDLKMGGGHTVSDNIIGTDITHTKAFGNMIGIAVLGGTGSVIERNIIKNSILVGIVVAAVDFLNPLNQLANEHIFRENFIGYSQSDTTNISYGVVLVGKGTIDNSFVSNEIANNNLGGISTYSRGGFGPPSDAMITFDFRSDYRYGPFVLGPAGPGNSFVQNSIHGNGWLLNPLEGLGINLTTAKDPALEPELSTPNDIGDADEGPNDLQNFPILIEANRAGNSYRIKATFNSLPRQKFQLEFFRNTNNESQGEIPLKTKRIRTNIVGDKAFKVLLKGVVPGDVITATATLIKDKKHSSTSAFSNGLMLP